MKVAIFDLDGVIVDTAQYHFEAWKDISEKLNYTLSKEKNEALKGVSRVDSLKRILEWAGTTIEEDAFQSFLVEKNEAYLAYVEVLGPGDALPGVIPFLEELKQKGIPVALGSASKNARPILERLKITHLFEAIVDGNDVRFSKPNPEVFLRGAQKLNSKPENCVIFEDSQAGIEAALAAKMTAIAIGKEGVLKNAAHYIPDFEKQNLETLAAYF